MRVACRIALALLGGLMAWSAGEHWVGSGPLREHYAASALGAGGRVGVAVAQSVAAAGLLWPRAQVATGLTLAAVMLAAAATHLRAGAPDPGVWLPLAIGAWAAAPAAALARRTRRRT